MATLLSRAGHPSSHPLSSLNQRYLFPLLTLSPYDFWMSCLRAPQWVTMAVVVICSLTFPKEIVSVFSLHLDLLVVYNSSKSLQKLSPYNIVLSRSSLPVIFAFSYPSAQHTKILMFSEVDPWHTFSPWLRPPPTKRSQPFTRLKLLPPDKWVSDLELS